MKIVLVRHTSVALPKEVCYGYTDVPLKETFEEEATVVGRNLEAMGIAFDAVFCSPLSRCRKLAAFCGYSAVDDSRLMELNFGDFEMMTFDDIYKDPRSKRVPNGESFGDQLQRVRSFLEQLKSGALAPGAENVLLFTHGGVLLCAQIIARVVKREEAFDKLTPYGGIVTITI